jgi:hypothetical protein
LVLPAQAKYSGGSGTAQDPYRIATAADLIALGETPADYDKHFLLTADIDLDPKLPGRKVFDKAVIAPPASLGEWGSFQGTAFAGVFDGNGHMISHLTITGKDYLGLFGQLGYSAKVRDLGVVDVKIAGSGRYVGGLVGSNGIWLSEDAGGTVTQCYSTGAVSGKEHVGGLVGGNGGDVARCYSMSAVTGGSDVGGLVGCNGLLNESTYVGSVADCYSTGAVSGSSQYGSVGGLVGWNGGPVTHCYSTAAVSGNEYVGGLVGSNEYVGLVGPHGAVTECYSTGAVTGDGNDVGGLVGWNGGPVTHCYSTATVSGNEYVGGLVGSNEYDRLVGLRGTVTECYSTGAVTGDGNDVGGLVGHNNGGPVTGCLWDTQTSGQAKSAGGTGKPTGDMQDPRTFMVEGWDFVGQADAPNDIWAEPEGGGYPILWWQLPSLQGLPRFSGGTGEPNDPYMISRPEELNNIGHNPRLMECRFKVVADLDLTGSHFYPIGCADCPYGGVFDGNGHTISHLTIKGEGFLGVFGYLASGAEVKDLSVVDVNITGSEGGIGGLVGWNEGTVTQCYSMGSVRGDGCVGGLVGANYGSLTDCHSTGAVTGKNGVGGLVGYNDSVGTVTGCYSTGAVSGDASVGGLVGENQSRTVTHCYSTAAVSGDASVGGLIGLNWYGTVTQCYGAGAVSGGRSAGGLVGENFGTVICCYSNGTVNGGSEIGGLVGENWGHSVVTQCYSNGTVSGGRVVGGLVGWNDGALTQCYSSGAVNGVFLGGLVGTGPALRVTASFWDTKTSGQDKSAGGTGKTTIEMQTAKTFLDAGWDFVDETANGTEDIWWILEGKDYPHLSWEAHN